MASISIKNFPDDLYIELNERARCNGRPLDDEIIDAARLLMQESQQQLSKEDKLLLADRVRRSTPAARIDDKTIRRAREEGRA